MLSKIRIKYAKTGKIQFLSHLDFMTLLHRAVMRANIPIAFSHGFNPHPKISFGPALSVGTESEAEYLDMDTDPFVDFRQAAQSLNSLLPEGLRIVQARTVPKNTPSLSGSIGRYVYAVAVQEVEVIRGSLPSAATAFGSAGPPRGSWFANRADGSLDPGFGVGGIVRIGVIGLLDDIRTTRWDYALER